MPPPTDRRHLSRRLRNTSSPRRRTWLKRESGCLAFNSSAEYALAWNRHKEEGCRLVCDEPGPAPCASTGIRTTFNEDREPSWNLYPGRIRSMTSRRPRRTRPSSQSIRTRCRILTTSARRLDARPGMEAKAAVSMRRRRTR